MAMAIPAKRQSKNSLHHGFSLTETLLAVAIMAIVSLVIVALFGNFAALFVADDEQVLARQRGMDAIKLLEIPVLHVGLGLPSNVSDDEGLDRSNIFAESFPASSNAPFKDWEEVLHITGGSSEDLRLLYAVESGVFQIDENPDAFYTAKKGDTPGPENLKLTGKLDAAKVTENTPSTTSSWITFPGQSLPMYVSSGLGTDTPQVKAFRGAYNDANYNERIRAFSEVLYVRAIRAWVDSDDVFTVMEVEDSDVRGSGKAQTAPGILRAQFYRDANARTLHMDLLTRGNTRDVVRVNRTKQARPDLVSRWNLTDAELEYTLDEVSMTWRIRNYEYTN